MVEPSHYESTLEKVICESLDLVGWVQGDKNNYSRPLGLDVEELRLFIEATQPDAWKKLVSYHGGETQAWSKFTKRLSSELNERGVVDVLRKGIKDTGVKIELAYFAPAHELTPEMRRLYDGNRLCVTRQVKMSESATEDSIDLVFFVNGIPVATAELKAQTAGRCHQAVPL
jgi:type I restriction enzyme R subunit